MAKQNYGMDVKKQNQIGKQANFRLDEYLNEMMTTWTGLDQLQQKELSKMKFYKFLNESKLLQNADMPKTVEMLKQTMVNFGNRPI